MSYCLEQEAGAEVPGLALRKGVQWREAQQARDRNLSRLRVELRSLSDNL